MSAIHYSEMLKIFDAADHENGTKRIKSLTYLDCNRGKRTGGNWITMEDIAKCGLPYHCADHEMRGIIDQTGKKTAVHLRLVFEINGQTVYP